MNDQEALCRQLLARGSISKPDLAAARAIAQSSGGELGWVLAAMGRISRAELFNAMSEAFGIPLVDDAERLRRHLDIDLISKLSYEEVINYSFLPFSFSDGTLIIATSRPHTLEIHEFAKRRFGAMTIAELLLTDLDLTVMASRTFRDDLVDEAIMKNFRRDPEQSARQVFTRAQLIVLATILIGLTVVMYFDPVGFIIVLMTLFQLLFIAGIIFKAVLSVAGAQNEIRHPIGLDEIANLDEIDLPVYTVLVPVYKEPEVVGHLIAGITKLDYPQHKLDLILLLEEDDILTLEAAKAAHPPANWRFIVVPTSQPRTKPKACNYGLFFARGEYLVIYDAEDIPEPNQLKMAVAAFRKKSGDYVCFQAALNYFNSDENLLTRMFTLEYSYWFDYLIPGLDRLRLPIPLGGTSNHFDVAKLRKLGGWDPFNTTEDADLGIRASALRYRVGYINSTTYEEANTQVASWIRQRSRWVKGYLQTFLVYARHPVSLIRQIGFLNFMGFALFIGGTPATFLAQPPLWLLFVFWLITKSKAIEPIFPDTLVYLALGNLLLGNFLGIFLNMIGIYLRKNHSLMPYALLNPLYWTLHSIAAYRAVWQLFTRPFYWEKTQHGVTRVRPKTLPAQRAAEAQ